MALKSTLDDGINISKASKDFYVPPSTPADYDKRTKMRRTVSVSKPTAWCNLFFNYCVSIIRQ